MKSRILKAFIGILVLVISPLFMVVVIGTLILRKGATPLIKGGATKLVILNLFAKID
jgi:hypothetical protein